MPTRPPSGELPPIEQARDWIALWQSELAALAVDREAQESVQALVALWANAANALLAAHASLAIGPDGFFPPGSGRPAATPGAAPAAAAFDPRDAELARLAAHIAELERRIAGLERERDGKRRR